MEQETINACAFFIKDEEGNIREAGIIVFKKIRSYVQIEVRTFTDAARQKMVKSRPRGGTAIVDKMTDGKIELLASEMDNSVPFSAITTAIDHIRERFDVPIIKVPKTKTIAIRPNPAKS